MVVLINEQKKDKTEQTLKLIFFSRGYAKRRNDYYCGSEYANLSLTQM